MLAQAAAATVAVGDDLGDFSVSSSESAEFDSGSIDQLYKLQGNLDDIGIFYSDDDDLDAYFDRGLDKIEKDIEYSDPKKSNPGCRRTTTIAGGPAPPDCTGMDQNEVENAMALYKVQRKVYVDQICGQ